jgi:hypothetical protein
MYAPAGCTAVQPGMPPLKSSWNRRVAGSANAVAVTSKEPAMDNEDNEDQRNVFWLFIWWELSFEHGCFTLGRTKTDSGGCEAAPAFNIVWLMCRHFNSDPTLVNALPSGIFFDFVHTVICNPFECVCSAGRAHGERVTIT